jgi:serine/threonine-protein kinase
MKMCTQCGKPMPGESAEGLCARCLLSVAMRTATSAAATEAPVTSDQRSSSSPASSGQLGPIQLVRQIGRGGMGEVWLGRHELLGRNVAVKILTQAVIDKNDPAFSTFIAGARVAASLEHPALNKVFHADIAFGVPYLVLELLDGPDLGKLVEISGPLDLQTARSVLEAIGDGIAELNQHGLVHRDLKPANVVLTRDGRVVVTDFGLACARPVAGAAGGVAGTPAYMAAEMFDGVVSVKTDVYALGMTAYHLLAGRTAYLGSLEEQQRQHREGRLDVEPLRARGVPDGVIDVIVRATNPDPVFRSKTARNVRQGFAAAFDAAGVRPASRDELVNWLRTLEAPAAKVDQLQTISPSPSSFVEALAELATRKRQSRGTIAPDVLAVTAASPAPAAPASPVWAWVGRGATAMQRKYPTHAARQRAERRRVKVAAVVAALFGAGVGIGILFCVARLMPRMDFWLHSHPVSAGWAVLISVCEALLEIVAIMFSCIGATILTYRLLRGERSFQVGEHTACGWCKHVLSGLSEPICPECGHRIGDRGPDRDGQRPLCLTWSWQLRVLFLMLVFCSVTVVFTGLLMNFLAHFRGVPKVLWPIEFLPATAFAIAQYEAAAQLSVYNSGRAWCRACATELKDLTEPACPSCHTRI